MIIVNSFECICESTSLLRANNSLMFLDYDVNKKIKMGLTAFIIKQINADSLKIEQNSYSNKIIIFC